MTSSHQASPNLSNFHRLLHQVSTATQQVVSPEKPWCEIDGVLIALELLEWPSYHCILVTFTDKNFEIRDADTLAYLLNLNRQIAKESPFSTLFALDETGKHLQLHQRIQVGDLPVWTIDRYFKETIERLQSMFVYTAE
jgi:hypothetical protein